MAFCQIHGEFDDSRTDVRMCPKCLQEGLEQPKILPPKVKDTTDFLEQGLQLMREMAEEQKKASGAAEGVLKPMMIGPPPNWKPPRTVDHYDNWLKLRKWIREQKGGVDVDRLIEKMLDLEEEA